MKALLIILVSLSLSLGASAQHRSYHHAPRYYAPRTHVYITPSYGFNYGYGYPYLGYPYYANPFYYNYGNPYYTNRVPYKLSLQIQSIKVDYRNRIRETRNDKSLSHSERRKEIRSLKAERDQQIIKAQQDYVNSRRSRNQNPVQ